MEAAKRQQTAQMIGTERAALSAGGVDTSSGSPVRLQSDTTKLGEQDALTIRNNAARTAYGFQTQGIDYQAQSGLDMMKAKNATEGGELGAFSSLIGGASSVADKWAHYKLAGVNNKLSS